MSTHHQPAEGVCPPSRTRHAPCAALFFRGRTRLCLLPSPLTSRHAPSSWPQCWRSWAVRGFSGCSVRCACPGRTGARRRPAAHGCPRLCPTPECPPLGLCSSLTIQFLRGSRGQNVLVSESFLNSLRGPHWTGCEIGVGWEGLLIRPCIGPSVSSPEAPGGSGVSVPLAEPLPGPLLTLQGQRAQAQRE